ncbi:hypothetical protein E1B28_002970 [Marasmius oreades]|uniref:Uncharacterized protein n=1 Tax=Marasmius oreades TaxID=181124 RepID=A0A9P7RK52_9AGAR|nr:uncharacterized protein E1B28_002970 [Marasmius oreades]KAG7085409.1 hypothetical protein E1B28_002970 [Marasmius oreades]
MGSKGPAQFWSHHKEVVVGNHFDKIRGPVRWDTRPHALHLTHWDETLVPIKIIAMSAGSSVVWEEDGWEDGWRATPFSRQRPEFLLKGELDSPDCEQMVLKWQEDPHEVLTELLRCGRDSA